MKIEPGVYCDMEGDTIAVYPGLVIIGSDGQRIV